MANLTHSERLAIALAMRNACVAKLMESAPSKENDGYRASNDPVRGLAASLETLDPMEVLAALDGRPTIPETEHTAFEQAAALQFFNTQRRDNGEYFHPITVRAWKLWQMANNFKEDSAMPADIAPDPAPKNELAEALGIIAAQPKPDSAAIADAMIAEAVIPAPAVCQPVEIEVRTTTPVGPPTLKLGEITERLGFNVTAEFLLSLGFTHGSAKGQPGKLYHEADFPRICAALLRHIAAVQAAH